MNVQQGSSPENIIFQRDSVAAGDDVTAPHQETIKFESSASIESVLEKILAARYLPSIQGGKATWIVVGKFPLAVVAQQWLHPRYMIASTTPVEELIEFSAKYQLDFRYWAQADPNKVVDSIKQGKPWPDRYGRD